MPDSNPYASPIASDDSANDDNPPPEPTAIIRLIPSVILGSILVGYALAFAVAMWTRPPPNARMLPLLFFGIPPIATAVAMTMWALARYRRRRTWSYKRHRRAMQSNR